MGPWPEVVAGLGFPFQCHLGAVLLKGLERGLLSGCMFYHLFLLLHQDLDSRGTASLPFGAGGEAEGAGERSGVGVLAAGCWRPLWGPLACGVPSWRGCGHGAAGMWLIT